MKLEPLQYNSLTDMFVDQLQNQIFSGELEPGYRMPPERTIAREMGISQTIVNNGFSILAGRGLLKIIPRKGTFVADYRNEGGLETLSALINYARKDLPDQVTKDMYHFRLMCEREYFSDVSRKMTDEDRKEFITYKEKISENINDKHAFAESCYNVIRFLSIQTGSDLYRMIITGFKPMYLAVFEGIYETGEMDEYLHLLNKAFQAVIDADINGIAERISEYHAYELKKLEKNGFFDTGKPSELL